MKKVFKSVVLASLVIITSAFSTGSIEKKDVKESKITWKGTKILGSHTGTIDLKEGYLEMDGDNLKGGVFIVDMTSIVNTDLSDGSKQKLEGHLKSEDFFGVEKFPAATLTIKSATKKGNTYTVTSDLTIKGITEPLIFELAMGSTGARALLTIDRTKYNIKYKSGSYFDSLGDGAISDDFELDIMMKF